MLTDSEKRWLQLRKLYAGVNYWSYYSCMHCPEYNIGRWRGYNHPCDISCLGNGCPNIDIRSSWAVLDYVEAVEFEARVAVKLAKAYELIASNCEGYEFDPCSFCRINVVKTLSCMPSCADTVLRRMRFEVEEEMNGNVCKKDTA